MTGNEWMILPAAITATAMHALPWLSRRDFLFGAALPPGFSPAERRRLIQRYELRLLPWTIAALILLTAVLAPILLLSQTR